MKKIFEIAKNSPLFHGIAFSDFGRILDCLMTRTADYKKDEIVLLAGNWVNFVGLILSGGVKIVKEDDGGNITLVNKLFAPEIFGEVFACAEIFHSPVTVQAAEDSEILFMDFGKMASSCTNACDCHKRLIKNMLNSLAQKNLSLNQKIDILSKRTTRDKLLCFFEYQRGGAKKFVIPFNREELADFICVDRSAMSRELHKMQNEGIIKFNKNTFEIL
ncbi:MAG: Crp/Fnr family transcriptional regulator [Clostridiales bacterium]|jgi:CRP-like cAMP-binding protein|nr:Crp/Fnr family transcriptional regulator [Clostridiales bacterium]